MAVRYHVLLMVFAIAATNFTMRSNLSVNIVAMVPVGNVSTSGNNSQISDYIYWTPYQRAIILGGSYWGSIIGTVLSGPLAERWSPRLMVFCAVLLGALLTLLSPLAAKQGFEVFFGVRLFIGYLSGGSYPCLQKLISKWAVPSEKSRFVGALVAGNLGTFFAWSVGGYLVDSFGWEWGFYAFGLLAPIVAIIWLVTIYDTPNRHPRISSKEKSFIGNIGINSRKLSPPIFQILTSIPVWSLVIAGFGSGWGYNFVSTTAPTYIANALGYDIKSTGVLSSSIYLSRSTVAIAFGYIGDVCLRKNWISLTMLRKGGTVISHILPGCILLGMTYLEFPRITYLFIILLSTSMNGTISLTSAVNIHDLTTNFLGTVAGIHGAAITAGGIVTPLVATYFTQDDETDVDLWRPVFYIGAAVYILAGIQFLIFGSTEKQPWDTLENDH